MTLCVARDLKTAGTVRKSSRNDELVIEALVVASPNLEDASLASCKMRASSSYRMLVCCLLSVTACTRRKVGSRNSAW